MAAAAMTASPYLVALRAAAEGIEGEPPMMAAKAKMAKKGQHRQQQQHQQQRKREEREDYGVGESVMCFV